ncbi:MAG TPA: SPFH domain-containing protein [Nocardioidaceae bacterium]|nr:SPFH domain-containing protein [Nocardioidaceae bacterium]
MSLFTIAVATTERVLEQRAGEATRVLEPGRHRRRRGARYLPVDVRQRMTTTAPQEVLTADGVTVKVTAALRWSVSDPVLFAESVEDPAAVVYLATQIGLREALADLDVAAVIRSGRRAVSETVTQVAQRAATGAGIAVHEVVVKDVVLSHELRASFAEVVTVRQRGQAKLEAARAETAALRSLANAAKLLDEHPALARLRLVQALPVGSRISLDASARLDSAED